MAADSDNGDPMARIAPGTPVMLIDGDPDRTARVLEALGARGLRVVRWTSSEVRTEADEPGAMDSDPVIDQADVWLVDACHVPSALEVLRRMRPQLPIVPGALSEPGAGQSLEGLEWAYIQRALSDCGGNISATARRLGIHRRSLQRKLAKVPPTR